MRLKIQKQGHNQDYFGREKLQMFRIKKVQVGIVKKSIILYYRNGIIHILETKRLPGI